MPVSGNEEQPGVLARQSSNSSSGIPIKKRWYSMVRSPSPPPVADPPSLSNENESKSKDSVLSPPASILNSSDSGAGKSDTPKSSPLEVKEERSAANIDCLPTTQPFLSLSRETNPDTSSGFLRNVDNQVKPALAEKVAFQEMVVATLVDVKKEVVAKQGESDCKLDQRPADSGHFELSLGTKEPHVSSLAAQNTGGSGLMPESVNPSLLSLSLNKAKNISQDGKCKSELNNSDADETTHTNRSNWDLNTPMDSWEGSGDDAPLQDASHLDLLGRTSSDVDKKPSISSTSVIGDKGKQVVGASEQEFNFPALQPNLPYKSTDVLRLSLGSTLRGFDASVLHSLSKLDSSKFSPNSNLLKNLALNISMNSPASRIVKSEPLEDTSVQANAGTACRPARTLEANVVQTELQRQNMQSIELSTKGPQKLLEKKPVKCEPPQEEICMTADVMAHQSVGRVLQLQESSSSSTLPMPLTPQKGCPSRLSTCSDLSVSGDLSTQSEYFVHTNEASGSKNALDQANADISAKIVKFDLKESNISKDKVEASVLEGMNIQNHMVHTLARDPNHLVASGEGSAIDEEKISISAGTEEECYGTDYESDGNHAFGGHIDTGSGGCGREDEEYEDGEVREPMMQSIVEDPIAEGMDSETNNESSSKNVHPAEFSGIGESHCLDGDEKNNSLPVHVETNDDIVKGCDEKSYQIDHKASNLQSPLLEEEKTGADEQRPISAIPQEPLDQAGTAADVSEGCEKDVICDEPAGSSGAGTYVGEANNENIGGSNISTTLDSSLQSAEMSVDANSSKDLSNAGSKSRIITLPRASNVTSPCNVRTITGRSLSSRSGRDRYFDMEEEKFYPRRNRDENYADGPKFIRGRNQDRSFGSSRGNFMRGRGRGLARFDSLRSEWDSGRDFESYGGVSDFRFRRKRTAVVGESEIDCNDYDLRLEGAAFGSNRRRKPLNDALPSFRHPPARRLSPSGREDAAMMGSQMLRRAPRNISPTRCTGEDGSELVGLRHSDKFVRDFPADISDPAYSHQQSVYDGSDGHFVRGNSTKFTTMQRRAFPRLRSKSPVRSRTRSPGPWSSPRRRLNEGFNSLPDSSQHRSPAIYRDDRMRSSPRSSFTEEMVPRRRDSPSYTARRLNDMRDVDTVQEHGHPRSLSSRRSPTDRVFTRSNRRLEMLDRRERADGDDYFGGGQMHTGRFPELRSGGGGGSNDERRKYGERRGPVRSFRPPYNSENDNFRFHHDEGPRPFRFYPEADAEFVERSSTARDREFDANTKDRPLPRRMRNVEQQEGNFRQSGQVWDEEGFDDSRMKRRRF